MINSALFNMINYLKDDIKRINHALKVYGFASTICETEEIIGSEKLVTELAAVFHDIGIKEAERKHNSSAGIYQEIEGPAIAREFLDKLNLSDDIIERVCFLVGNHHSYQKIDGIDFQILVEADFLVNISEDKMSVRSIESVLSKYFKTETGITLLKSMYLPKTL